jgi:nucleoside-diphosphate-sugar epimerase
VSEAAKCIYLISSKKKCENQTFNVGSEKSTSIIELINIISKILKIKKKIIKSKSFVSDVKFNKCNSSKILKFTGYKPMKDIKNIINDLMLN